jgi:hypothetical protein
MIPQSAPHGKGNFARFDEEYVNCHRQWTCPGLVDAGM